MALEGRKKNTLVDLYNISPSNQDWAALLWSTSDETSLQSLIKNDITKDKTALGQDRQNISQAYAIVIDNGDPNSESITAIEKAMLKCLLKMPKMIILQNKN